MIPRVFWRTLLPLGFLFIATQTYSLSVTPVAIVTNRTSDILTSSVPTQIAIDGSYRTCIAGQGLDGRLTTALFAEDGTRLWVAKYLEITNAPNDRPVNIAFDAASNIYVTATSKGDGSKDDYLTVKIGPSGALQWSKRFNGASNDNDTATSMGFNMDGVYVTGYSFLRATQSQSATAFITEMRTLKYATDGSLLWSTNEVGNYGSEAHSLEFDSEGNPVVAGITYTHPPEFAERTSLRIVRYAASTGFPMSSVFQPSLHYTQSVTVAIDQSDNIYAVVFRSLGGGYFQPNLIKFNSAAVALWQSDIPAQITCVCHGRYKIAFNSTNVIVAGGPNAIKLLIGSWRQSDGATNWIQRWPDAEQDFRPSPDALWVNSAGDIYVSTSWKNSRLVTVKYLTNGTRAWESDLPTTFAGSHFLGKDRNGYVIRVAQARWPEPQIEHSTWRFIPSASPIARDQNGVASLRFRVNPLATHRVQHSTDFGVWYDVGTGISDAEGALFFTHTNSVNDPMRFYRAVP